MSDNLVTVFADEIYTGVFGGYPFAVGRIGRHIIDLLGVKQIVGIVGTVVAGHLYLIEAERRVALVFLCQFEETHVGSHPYILILFLKKRLHKVILQRELIIQDIPVNLVAPPVITI